MLPARIRGYDLGVFVVSVSGARIIDFSSLKYLIPLGVLLRVYPVTDKGQIVVLCFLSSAVGLANTEDNGSFTSVSSRTNLIVSCDDGTFCLLQCGVAQSLLARPLVDRYLQRVGFGSFNLMLIISCCLHRN